VRISAPSIEAAQNTTPSSTATLATLLMLGTIGVVWFIKRPKGPLKTVAH
jgi:hypothetical protein